MSKNTPLCIIVAADEAYAPGLAVAIRSLADHLHGRPILVHIIDGGILGDTQLHLRQSWPENAEPRFLQMNSSLLKELPLSKDKRASHINKAMYYRLFIPYLLPQTYHKALYLDVDTLVLADIVDLWETPLDGCAVAAVQDQYVQFLSSPQGLLNYEEIDPQNQLKYFNSGVLLLNLDIWRANDLSKHILKYIASNQQNLRLPDQDALNFMLYGAWKEVDPTWNVLIGESKKYADESKQENVLLDAKILHFVGKNKPWMPDFPACSYRKMYRAYQNRTCWSVERTKKNASNFTPR